MATEGVDIRTQQLWTAIFLKKKDVVIKLIDAGASLASLNVAKMLPSVHALWKGMVDKEGLPWSPLSYAQDRYNIQGARWIGHGLQLFEESLSPLFLAIWQRDIEISKILLAHGADNTPLSTGVTLLYFAASLGLADLCELLVSSAVPQVPRSGGYSPLHVAAQEGHASVCQCLLNHGASLRGDECGNTPLHVASTVEVAKLLIAHAAANCKNANDMTCQASAAWLKKYYTDKASSRHRHSSKNDDKYRQWQQCAQDLCDYYGGLNMALVKAAAGGDISTCTELLKSGASNFSEDYESNFLESHQSPLHAAAENGHAEMCALLLSAGFDSRCSYDTGLRVYLSPLDLAARAGHVAAAETLIRHLDESGELSSVWDPTWQRGIPTWGRRGVTPLLLAVSGGHYPMCELLLRSGATNSSGSTHFRNIINPTPLHVAASEGYTEICKLLLAHGFPQINNDYGESPLYFASKAGHRETCELLLQNGADPSATCAHRVESVMSVAANADIVELLFAWEMRKQTDTGRSEEAEARAPEEEEPTSDPREVVDTSAFTRIELIPAHLTILEDNVFRGGLATISRCTYQGVDVALKRPHALQVSSPATSLLDDLKREAFMLSEVRHKHVLGLTAICTSASALDSNERTIGIGLITQWVGQTLSGAIQADNVPWAQKLTWLLQVSKGMLALHERPVPILHRDLKATNVLVDEHGQAMVADLGLAGTLHGIEAGGSIQWSAPEVLLGEPTSKASDSYSFGMMMYEVAAKSIPWEGLDRGRILRLIQDGQTPQLQESSLPADYFELFKACVSMDPLRRPSFVDIQIRLALMVEDARHAPSATSTKSLTQQLRSAPWRAPAEKLAQSLSGGAKLTDPVGHFSATQGSPDFEHLRNHVLDKISPIMSLSSRTYLRSAELDTLQIVASTRLEALFYTQAMTLASRYSDIANPDKEFQPRWHMPARIDNLRFDQNETQIAWRRAVANKLAELPNWSEGLFSQIKVVVAFHAVKKMTDATAILAGGFAQLAKVDAGYFGQGLYFTTDLQYAVDVYSGAGDNGVILACALVIGNTYPVIESPRDPNALTGRPQVPGYDSHFAVVQKKSKTAFFPAPPSEWSHPQLPTYTELVVFDGAQVLPLAIFNIKKAQNHKWPSGLPGRESGTLPEREEDARTTSPSNVVEAGAGGGAEGYSCHSEEGGARGASLSTRSAASWSTCTETARVAETHGHTAEDIRTVDLLKSTKGLPIAETGTFSACAKDSLAGTLSAPVATSAGLSRMPSTLIDQDLEARKASAYIIGDPATTPTRDPKVYVSGDFNQFYAKFVGESTEDRPRKEFFVNNDPTQLLRDVVTMTAPGINIPFKARVIWPKHSGWYKEYARRHNLPVVQ